MNKITTRTTSVHRPMFLSIDEAEYKVDGIDTKDGDFNLDKRWIIDELLKEHLTDIKTHYGAHGEFYVATYMVDFNLIDELTTK